MKNIRRDEVDYLPENGVYCLRCFWWCLFLHNPVGYRITPPVATLNIHPIANAVSEWDANEKIHNLSKHRVDLLDWSVRLDGKIPGEEFRKKEPIKRKARQD